MKIETTGPVPRSSVGALLETPLALPLLHRGKVRDVYEVGADELLVVASDRVSAFDVVMSRPVPRKGEVLTLLTAWWLDRLRVDHHLLAVDPDQIERRHPELGENREMWARRAMLVRRATPMPVECVVRGYLSGSAWKEYLKTGTLAGEPMPDGLRESDRLPAPTFSPATKADPGHHDENIPFGNVIEQLGTTMAARLRKVSMEIYDKGCSTCETKSIILADTKFEFGLDGQGKLLLIDEVMTPDSSRFWPMESYVPGRGQPSLDKQPIRDWIEAFPDWDKRPPPPDLPDPVAAAATARYLEIFRRLTGVELDDWQPPHFGEDA